MRRLILLLLLALPLAAQDLFPRFSVTGAVTSGNFDTNVRIDPETRSGEGTLIGFERDLGLEDSRTLRRFGVQWQPFRRHELAVTYFSAPRRGVALVDREIRFRDQVYSIPSTVTSQLDLDYSSITYTFWARRSERDGLGITIGAANLAFDAAVVSDAQTAVAVDDRASTDVPVALAGLQGRVALTDRFHLAGSVSALPKVTIEGYTGNALTADARLEYRPVRWLGIGAAYNYFHLDVDVARIDISGTVDMTIQGPEAYLRLAF
jgi:hypothetical protein